MDEDPDIGAIGVKMTRLPAARMPGCAECRRRFTPDFCRLALCDVCRMAGSCGFYPQGAQSGRSGIAVACAFFVSLP